MRSLLLGEAWFNCAPPVFADPNRGCQNFRGHRSLVAPMNQGVVMVNKKKIKLSKTYRFSELASCCQREQDRAFDGRAVEHEYAFFPRCRYPAVSNQWRRVFHLVRAEQSGDDRTSAQSGTRFQQAHSISV